LKSKYVYFIIAGLMIAAVAYPVVYAEVNTGQITAPFFCAPLVPCTKQPPGLIICTTTCTVDMQNAAFSPGTINASYGSTVTWVNKDGFPHTVTAFNTSAWDSFLIPPGQTFTLLITTSLAPGSYYYYCSVHPFMIGLLNVLPDNSTST
jgi:plastocyanin